MSWQLSRLMGPFFVAEDEELDRVQLILPLTQRELGLLSLVSDYLINPSRLDEILEQKVDERLADQIYLVLAKLTGSVGRARELFPLLGVVWEGTKEEFDGSPSDTELLLKMLEGG